MGFGAVVTVTGAGKQLFADSLKTTSALVPPPIIDLKTVNPKAYQKLNRVQLQQPRVRYVREGLTEAGDFAFCGGQDNVKSVGKSVDIVPLARRPKAIDFTDMQNVIVTTDMQSDVFQDIIRRSNERAGMCQYGVSFLIAVRGSNELHELFLGTRSTRRIAGELASYLHGEDNRPVAVTLSSRMVESQRFTFYVPELRRCFTPFKSRELPSVDVIQSEIKSFLES
jgi:hypothetical protein